MISVIFCGSFQHYSTYVAQGLLDHPQIQLDAVITTPPQPLGKKKILTPTAVQTWSDENDIPVFHPKKLDSTSLTEIEQAVGQPDYLITAGYGKLVPAAWLKFPRLQALNLHFSVLPSLRGANPAEWALMLGESQLGISLITMSATFDTGDVLITAPYPITETDTRLTLYEAVYQLGKDKLADWVVTHHAQPFTAIPQPQVSPTPYAKRLARNDTFIEWEILKNVLAGKSFDPTLLNPTLAKIFAASTWPADASFIDAVFRATVEFPELWTEVVTAKGLKRLKVKSARLDSSRLVVDQAQIEGKPVQPWVEVIQQLLS